jgi:hypothetical protein
LISIGPRIERKVKSAGRAGSNHEDEDVAETWPWRAEASYEDVVLKDKDEDKETAHRVQRHEDSADRRPEAVLCKAGMVLPEHNPEPDPRGPLKIE